MKFFSGTLSIALAFAAFCPSSASAVTRQKHPPVKPDAAFSTPNTLYPFASSTLGTPIGNVMQAKDGNFYGVLRDTAGDAGALYQVTPAGTYTLMYTFDGSSGEGPVGGVFQGYDGNLYGLLGGEEGGSVYVFNIARQLMLGIYATSASGDVYDNGHAESLTQDSSGNLYGVDPYGGASGTGSVFEVVLNNTGTYPPPPPDITDVYDFGLVDDIGAAFPGGTPVFASDGNIYGYTQLNAGQGVWEYSPSTATLTPLDRFHDIGARKPVGGLVEASDGNLYGAVNRSGSSHIGNPALYELELSSGDLSTFHSYSGADENLMLYSGTPLVIAGGDIITAGDGGANGAGTITAVNVSDGSTYTDFYDFTGDSDGNAPHAMPSAAALGGTAGVMVGTNTGGGNNGEGVLYAFESFGHPSMTLTTPTTLLETGSFIELDWSVDNAFSISAQTCYAFSSDFSFSGAIPTSGRVRVMPAQAGSKQYSITCGGVESAVLDLTVINGTIALSDSNGNALTAGSIAFGAVPENSSVSQTITVTNTAAIAFPFAVTVTGSKARLFPPATTCPASVAAGASCALTLTYNAGGKAETDSAIYTIARQGFLFAPGNTGNLSASVVTPGVITLSATSHSFGTVAAGGNYTYTFQVFNGTGAAQSFGPPVVTQVSGPSGSSGYSTTCPATLAPNAICSVSYVLNTPSAGAYQVNVTAVSSATVRPGATVKLTATAH